MTFHERLSELMKKNNVTAIMLTEKLCIGKNQFTYWKKNGNIPSGDILIKLADYFDVTVDYLLGKTDIKKQTIIDGQSVSDKGMQLLEIATTLSSEDQQTLVDLARSLKSRQAE